MFEWDNENVRHIARHGVTPREAEEVVANDPFEGDEQFHDGEQRFELIGITDAFRCLVLIITWRGERIRVVTAYPADAADLKLYFRFRRS